jgi:hypothetical protein
MPECAEPLIVPLWPDCDVPLVLPVPVEDVLPADPEAVEEPAPVEEPVDGVVLDAPAPVSVVEPLPLVVPEGEP